MLSNTENVGNYTIHFEMMHRDEVTPEMAAVINKYFESLQNHTKNKKGVIADLKSAIVKYPDFPQFKNYLYNVLKMSGYEKEALKVLEDTLAKHPNYFFARADKAKLYLRDGNLEAAEALMGGEPPSNIQSLYPERKDFHITEVLNYIRYAIDYHLYKNEFDDAKKYVQNLEGFTTQVPDLLPEVQGLKKQVLLSRVTFNIERQQEIYQKSPKVESTRKYFFEPSDDEPIYNHPEIENLYYHDFGIPKELIEKILSLPRATLIEDLEKMLADFQIRNDFFYNEVEYETTEDSDYQWCFFFHPIFLLAELKAVDSLQAVLNLFRQDRDFKDYWFKEYIDEFIPPLYQLAQNQLKALGDYLKEENNETWSRRIIAAIPQQVALHQPARWNEVIDWYKDIFTYFIEQKGKQNLIDGMLLGSMVEDILDINAKELSDWVKSLYENELVNELVVGDWKKVETELQEFNFSARKYMLEADTFTLYQEIINPTATKYFDEEKVALLSANVKEESSSYKEDFDLLIDLLVFDKNKQKFSTISPPEKPLPVLQNLFNPIKYNRNERVNVRYQDGRVEKDVKFKKIEEDFQNGLCEIID
ncbi:MAG: DUF1186 domain-containing protein [Chitinophagales bacterium]|jgi:hypothetical protein|nr:DUF1186 domain-containing protein [Chitinophagales bacterium]